MSKTEEIKDVLVAMLPKVEDWLTLKKDFWYRIPQNSAPSNVKDGVVKIIGFYHTAKFSEDLKFKVVYYSKIKRIVRVTRRELFPDEPLNSTKAYKIYYKIECEPLQTLSKPIVSRRGHRGVFVPTTYNKFFSGTTDFNKLFQGSPLEIDMEKIIDEMEIEYEREWLCHLDKKKAYCLDFAIFCLNGAINIECDGDAYHMGNEKVHYDKTRNNELESYKWSVLRYTTKHFKEEREHIKKTIYKTIVQYGGAIKASQPNIAYFPKTNPYGQLSLF